MAAKEIIVKKYVVRLNGDEQAADVSRSTWQVIAAEITTIVGAKYRESWSALWRGSWQARWK
jgi:hypothetical protein